MFLPSFPSKVLCHGAPFPPQGPLGESSPDSSVLWSTPNPCRPSLWISFPSSSDTACVPASFAPLLEQALPSRGLGLVSGFPTPVLLQVETTGPPRFLGNPNVCMPRSSTPARSWRDAVFRQDVAFRLLNGVGSREENLSRLNSAAYRLPVYASQRGLPSRCATLGSGRRHAYRTGAGYPLGPYKRFQSFHLVLLSPGLAWHTEQYSRSTPVVGPTIACLIGSWIRGTHFSARLLLI